MFGLMKSRVCSQTNELKLHRRLHYCGTCKTLGSMYGRKSRVMLNHDTVFLAEIMSAISAGHKFPQKWHFSYHTFNCLSSPRAKEQIPLPLQFAATTAVIITEFKIADHITDSKNIAWKAAGQFFSSSFEKAAAQLHEWRFPLDDLRSALLSQEAREAEARTSKQTADALLADLAEPTAAATALFFKHGARLAGQSAYEPEMASLGRSFGAMAYLIDALDDYGKDLKRGDFNAIQAAFRLKSDKRSISTEIRHVIEEKIVVLRGEIEKALGRLPMSEEMKGLFTMRLQANLSRKTGLLPGDRADMAKLSQTEECSMTQHACRVRLSLSERWQYAVQYAKKIVLEQNYGVPSGLFSRCGSYFQRTFVFSSVVPVAFLAPYQASDAATYRQCMSLLLNMIFLGTAAGTLARLATRPVGLAMQSLTTLTGGQVLLFGAGRHTGGPDINPENHLKNGKESGNGCGDCCDGCNFCDCDACDCCGGCDGCSCDC